MPKAEPNYIPYYPRAPERHVFSPERSISPELQILSGSLHSLHVGDTHPRGEPPSSEDNVSDLEEDSNRTLNNSRPSSPAISTGSSELTIEEDFIPKPKGSVGKPGGGGYSLHNALGWDTKDYKATQVYIRSLAQELLDESLSFSAQDPAVIEEICLKADIKFPRLKTYKDRWATKDFLAGYHKNSTSRTKPNSRQKERLEPSPDPSEGAQTGASSKAKSVTFEGADHQAPLRKLRNRGPR